MRSKLYILLIFILALSGCKTLDLDPKWKPLENVKENPYQPRGVVTTYVPSLYVNNLERWVKNNPPGSANREYLLRHERVHAYRQLKMGKRKFVIRYAANKQFRWNEERLAEYVGIRYLVKMGRLKLGHPATTAYIERRAKWFSGKTYKGMISYEEVKKWIEDVIADKWKPQANEPLPPPITKDG